ncbi:hypothetical protein ACQEUU_37775 [Nonomuraea sp. CA-218870]|uniref:hypothetical protein n=1 Tax=Nonomuraea sp. CA-218870 TaxID=3239998 RepID=UPI003D8B5D9B
MMARYFDPICEHMHNREDLPTCPTRGVNFSRGCEGCERVAGVTPCGVVAA